jgi:sporulation protein YlmC with PRC-barrel domain
MMNAKRLEQLAVTIATALCAQALWADPPPDQTQDQQAGQTKDTSTQAASSAKAGLPFSKLKGATVKSSDSQELGKLDDIVIDPQTGKVNFAIIGKGGALGVGEKRMPIPWQALHLDSAKQLTLNVDKQKMQSAPTVSQDYSDLNSPEQVVAIYRFYELPPSGGAETPGGTGAGAGQQQPPENTPPSSKP